MDCHLVLHIMESRTISWSNRHELLTFLKSSNVEYYKYDNRQKYLDAIKDVKVKKWLQHCGSSWNRFNCLGAFEDSRDEVGKWLIVNGCPYDGRTICEMVVVDQDVELAAWLVENGSPLNAEKFESNHGCVWTVEMIQFLIDHGCRLTEKLYTAVVQQNDQKLLDMLIENNCPVPESYSTDF